MTWYLDCAQTVGLVRTTCSSLATVLAENSSIPPRPVPVCYQLEIYGGEYEITDLEAGSLYFARIFARNQMVGWGDASLTTPVSMIPRSAPEVCPIPNRAMLDARDRQRVGLLHDC